MAIGTTDGHFRTSSTLTPAEARELGERLLRAAEQAETDLASQPWAGSSYRALANDMAEVTFSPAALPRTSIEHVGNAA
ncbi:hypothetical protein [Ideonella paludis]|uniref:Uncharacterized protein n=1 Tax=Ideonella paludis TaxID=1233411 RepID=A0ABS5DU11_9BURK|nr:hypothetical protein [Ideonella paludis]MBQ0934629.1 hypothetical protein [Ideonella paludis]